jgi:hypothetical protein
VGACNRATQSLVFFGITDFIMAGYGFRLRSSSEVESLTRPTGSAVILRGLPDRGVGFAMKCQYA